ncbi:DUF421 domain-containing protein [Gracilibacillus dipsosauri]|uniref:DUF421 domain-containing protein n=1 Tax=Gracilibacillus dipsosauri TaxID=178340 RepID=A0A317L146_9BACI|nr:DUF421 domain-containing protein [Gracilibacillus dipsosauri]PWU69547.1 DUF421 domain-containing protein [Gracilibacillus dipsosauri]
MEWDLVWKAILIVLAGTLLLRFAGRKTISQMTLAETIIMISIGTLLIQPVSGKNIWTTLIVGALLVITLITMEYLQMKSDSIEKLITGKSKILIENGTINEQNLKKLRLTVDQLEMMLRQSNVANIKDVEFATLEPNGQIGYTLKQEAQPVTKKEFQQLMQILTTSQPNPSSNNLFTEVSKQSHDQDPPKHLQ